MGRMRQYYFLPSHELATAQALREKNPNIEIDFASFPKVEQKVARVSPIRLKKTPFATGIMFHNTLSQTVSRLWREREGLCRLY
jgi:hypothetical protein